MCFDLTVLVLTAVKLAMPTKRSERSKLVKLIFNDGLIYFVVAFVANLLATVRLYLLYSPVVRLAPFVPMQIFILIDLNPVMSIIADVPAAIASTIVACRAVRRLTNYTSRGPEVFK